MGCIDGLTDGLREGLLELGLEDEGCGEGREGQEVG